MVLESSQLGHAYLHGFGPTVYTPCNRKGGLVIVIHHNYRNFKLDFTEGLTAEQAIAKLKVDNDLNFRPSDYHLHDSIKPGSVLPSDLLVDGRYYWLEAMLVKA